MNHDEGLGLGFECTLFDGLRSAGHDVTHVLVRDVLSAQGELGHNVSEVCDPLGGGGSIVHCAVNCYNTHTYTYTHTQTTHTHRNTGD